MLIVLLLLFFIVALGGGRWGQGRFGYVGWSPAGVVVLVAFGLWFTGNLHW